MSYGKYNGKKISADGVAGSSEPLRQNPGLAEVKRHMTANDSLHYSYGLGCLRATDIDCGL